MKTAIMTASLASSIFFSFNSQAMTVDRFQCELTIRDVGTNQSTRETKNFDIARVPLSISPAADIRLTAGQSVESLRFSTSAGTVVANLNFYFKHAVRVDSSGVPLEARQLTCVGLSANYCPKSSKIEICDNATVTCLEPAKPFDVKNGWSPSVLNNGIPGFNEQTLNPSNLTITSSDGTSATVVSSCVHTGTFE